MTLLIEHKNDAGEVLQIVEMTLTPGLTRTWHVMHKNGPRRVTMVSSERWVAAPARATRRLTEEEITEDVVLRAVIAAAWHAIECGEKEVAVTADDLYREAGALAA